MQSSPQKDPPPLDLDAPPVHAMILCGEKGMATPPTTAFLEGMARCMFGIPLRPIRYFVTGERIYEAYLLKIAEGEAVFESEEERHVVEEAAAQEKSTCRVVYSTHHFVDDLKKCAQGEKMDVFIFEMCPLDTLYADTTMFRKLRRVAKPGARICFGMYTKGNAEYVMKQAMPLREYPDIFEQRFGISFPKHVSFMLHGKTYVCMISQWLPKQGETLPAICNSPPRFDGKN